MFKQNDRELMNCPFCGSEETEIAEGTYALGESVVITHNVLCGNCNAMGPDTRFGADSAAEKWNLRKPDC